MPGNSSIETKLFDLFDRHVKSIKDGELKADSVVKKDAPIITFCQTLFAQFFENEFGYEIISIDEQTKEQATRIRLDLGDSDSEVATQRLVASFEELCDLWDDVLGSGYGGSTGEFRRFHRKFIPRLLKRVLSFAQKSQYRDLSDRCAKAITDYETVVKRL